MKNKILLIVMVLLIILSIVLFTTACTTREERECAKEIENRFIIVEGRDGILPRIEADRETGVCYYVTWNHSMCPLLHADGTPFLYIDGEVK